MNDQSRFDGVSVGPALPVDPVPVPPPLPVATVSPPERMLFTGSGAEYFKIWIVNLLLTIATLGVYSAWAKVRRLQYFYRHMRLAGASFDYHGEPLAILKGRIVGALLFGAYYAAGLAGPAAAAAAFVGLVVAIPFFLVRALRFHMANSSYRGLRFAFSGGTGEAYRVFLGLGVASVLTFFLLLPFWMQRQMRYVRNNIRFGRTPFAIDAPVGSFYRIYLAAFAAGAALLAVIATLLAVMVGSAVAAGADPESFNESVSATAAALLIASVYILGAVGIWSYVNARVQNLVWNGTQLGPHRFRCQLRARTLVLITVTNLIAIVLTIGLYKPFAEVRLMRYMSSVFTLVPAGALDEFVAGEQQHASALGYEAMDMFDVDIGF